MRLVVATACALLGGCGASTPGPAARGADGARCPAVARHLVALAILDNGLTADPVEAEKMAATPPEPLRGTEAEFRGQCEREGWSPARRDCLHAARTQEGTLGCPDL